MTNIMGNSNDDLLQASEVENLDNLNKMHPSREKQLRGSNDIGRKRKRDMGRGEYGRREFNKKNRNDEEQERRRLSSIERKTQTQYPSFSKDEIAMEDRRPKRKVAVLLGYSGSGYLGMQLTSHGKTIEGDLFNAFVAAGAISKANADDPKKSSLVRCARTDKGVHAAGNVISLKLIVEDKDIVNQINAQLSPQVRIYGIISTTGSFSCYSSCDSRIYEYLIPTHAFLPPHPSSYMGKKLEEIAESKEDLEGFRSRQAEVADFWDTVDYASIAPLTKGFDDKIQKAVLQTLRDSGVLPTQYAREADLELSKDTEWSKAEAATIENSIRQVKAAHLKAKKEYRLDPRRLARVREGLGLYLGTKNFYNYTVNKTSKDPSARRLIKTFIAEDPIIIGGTEWLSLKIHGQSFMMHQIRKMISMVALVVRTGCPLSRITDSLTAPMSIPKLPGLGLLLERPVFDTYNQRAVEQFHKETLDFDKYTSAIMEFKQREIYDRIFREEEETNTFHQWFGHIDSFRTDWYLYLSSAGTEASPKKTATGWLGHEHNQKAVDRPPNLESDDEDEAERAQGADIGG